MGIGAGMRGAARVHAIRECSMCKRESYIRMIYCVPMTREHFAFCRECADGLLSTTAHARITAAAEDGLYLPESP